AGEVTGERDVVHTLEGAGIPFRIASAGVRSVNKFGSGSLSWEVLAPRGELPPADTNAASLIMRVDLGSSTVLLLGDSGEEEHAALLQSDANLSADVVKVAHHGSSDLDTGVFAASGARWYL